MKIKKLKIEDHYQLKNLELDFTYPAGHKKAGQPLNKVCFIGQSGTGKTSLLEILDHRIVTIIVNNDDSTYDPTKLEYDDGTFAYFDIEGIEESSKIEHPLLHIKSEIQANAEVLEMKSIEDTPKQLFNSPSSSNTNNPSPTNVAKIIELDNVFYSVFWRKLLKDIENYDILLDKKTKDLATEISKGSVEVAAENFKNWKKENPNPRTKIAKECLDSILRDFNLKVNLESSENSYFPIQYIDGTEVPPQVLSTGTKQVLLTALPIYLLNTKDTIILFDEPERSLFPDIQLKIVDYYTRLAPDAQFFFATHSPMIAAAFEPCERFILRFDESGYVSSDSVYKGDSPIGDDPNDVLSRDFGVRYINEHGIRQWEYYLDLKKRMRSEKDEEEKKKLMLETAKLGNLYKYPV